MWNDDSAETFGSFDSECTGKKDKRQAECQKHRDLGSIVVYRNFVLTFNVLPLVGNVNVSECVKCFGINVYTPGG